MVREGKRGGDPTLSGSVIKCTNVQRTIINSFWTILHLLVKFFGQHE